MTKNLQQQSFNKYLNCIPKSICEITITVYKQNTKIDLYLC